MASQIEPMSHAEEMNFLYDMITESGVRGDLRIGQAFARVFWVRNGFDYDLADALQNLQSALKVFKELGKKNRRFSRIIRDTQTFVGNAYVKYGDHKKAIDWYEKALEAEQDFAKRSLNYLNIARALMHEGELYRAMRIANRIANVDSLDPRLITYFNLMRAKIFLFLGYEEECQKIQSQTRGRSFTDNKVKVESLYLKHNSRFRLARPETVIAEQTNLIKSLETSGVSEYVDFYRSELLLYRYFMPKKSIRNRNSALNEARSLALKMNDRSHLKIAILADQVLLGNQIGNSRKLAKQILELGPTNTRFTQVLNVLLNQHLLRQRRSDVASWTLDSLKLGFDRLESGFSPALLRSMADLKSDIRDTIVVQASRIEKIEEKEDQKMLSILFE